MRGRDIGGTGARTYAIAATHRVERNPAGSLAPELRQSFDHTGSVDIAPGCPWV